jgi:hypothetical protein
MTVSRIGLDWKPVSYLNPDITVELARGWIHLCPDPHPIALARAAEPR